MCFIPLDIFQAILSSLVALKISAKSMAHHRQELNNYVQSATGRQNVVAYQKEQPRYAGLPLHLCPWVATCTISGVPYGRATHMNLGEAKEEAARLALIEYRAERLANRY